MICNKNCPDHLTVPGRQVAINIKNKKAFQLNANRMFSDSACIIVNKFECLGLGVGVRVLYSEVQGTQVRTCRGGLVHSRGWRPCTEGPTESPPVDRMIDGQTRRKTLPSPLR